MQIMEYPFEDKTALIHIEETKTQSPEQIIYEQDIKIKELDTRLRSLEQLVNYIHNKFAPVWWGQQ